MIGAIIGDIVGSRFEWNNHRSKDFDLLPHQCFFTDDSVMSLAVCVVVLISATFQNKLSFPCKKSDAHTQAADMGGHFTNGCIPTTHTRTIAMATELPCASAAAAMLVNRWRKSGCCRRL